MISNVGQRVDDALPIYPVLGRPERDHAALGMVVRNPPGLVKTDRVHGPQLMPKNNVSLSNRDFFDAFFCHLSFGYSLAFTRGLRFPED